MAPQLLRHLNTSPVKLELKKQKKWEWSICWGTTQTMTYTQYSHMLDHPEWLLFIIISMLFYCLLLSSSLLYSDSRDIKDTTVGTLSQRITNQVHGLKGLNSKLLDIRSYLERVAAGKLPINHQIIYQLQDVFNLLPDVNLLVRCGSVQPFVYSNCVISCVL